MKVKVGETVALKDGSSSVVCGAFYTSTPYDYDAVIAALRPIVGPGMRFYTKDDFAKYKEDGDESYGVGDSIFWGT